MHSNVVVDSLERMKRRLKKVVFKTNNRQEVVFAFIDAQNIAKGIKNSGWNINWSKFRHWLADNYNVSQAHMYIGYMEKNQDLYLQLNNNGFNIVLKQMLKSNQEMQVGSEDVKGNVDVDLTIGAWQESRNYDKAIIISGDGDFASLIQHLQAQKKLKKVIVPEFYSALFQQFDEYILKINDYREELVYVKGSKKPDKLKGAQTASTKPKPQATVKKKQDLVQLSPRQVSQRLKRKIKKGVSLLKDN